MSLGLGIVSPQDWGLPVAEAVPDTTMESIGVSLREMQTRAKNATYEWLLGQFDEKSGAFHGHYRAPDQYLEPPQTVNLIAPWQMLAAYDRYQDPHLLEMARRAATWFYERHVVDHPMSVVAGGVRDGGNPDDIWTKFTAEEVITCLGMFARTNEDVWMDRALQSGRCLIQARRHGFSPRYRLSVNQWLGLGWDSWGRAVQANLLLWKALGSQSWRDEAVHWGNHALDIQAEDGAFYLIDGEYYNTDLAADELRALVLLYEVIGKPDFLAAARRLGDWHLAVQKSNGAWPLTIDRDGNVVMPTVGPGDIPNIAIALLRLHHVSGEQSYLDAAWRALRYALSTQIIPGRSQPYEDDPKVRWGFWSWDPYYDYTLSGDQSTHHARGMWFFMDYWAAYLAEA
jgi:hypothetical protein